MGSIGPLWKYLAIASTSLLPPLDFLRFPLERAENNRLSLNVTAAAIAPLRHPGRPACDSSSSRNRIPNCARPQKTAYYDAQQASAD